MNETVISCMKPSIKFIKITVLFIWCRFINTSLSKTQKLTGIIESKRSKRLKKLRNSSVKLVVINLTD